MTTSVLTFNFLALLISEIKSVSQNLMWGLLAPCRTSYAKTFMCAQSTWQGKQRAKFQHRIFMHHAVMGIYISHRLTIICAQKMGFLGVLKVKMWNYCLLTPKRHCHAWIRVRLYIAWQNRFNGLSSRLVERFLRTKKEIKNWVVTLAVCGEVIPGAILTKCWEIWWT